MSPPLTIGRATGDISLCPASASGSSGWRAASPSRESTYRKRSRRAGASGTRSCALPVVVVDASALVELLLATPRAPAFRQAIGDADMVACDLVNPEVVSVLRRLTLTGVLTAERAGRAVLDLREAPLRRFSTTPLVELAWSLRASISAYDAFHVALARVLRCPLLTGDLRLARAPGLGVPVVTVTAPA